MATEQLIQVEVHHLHVCTNLIFQVNTITCIVKQAGWPSGIKKHYVEGNYNHT